MRRVDVAVSVAPTPGPELHAEEFHAAATDWQTCRACGVDCPERSNRCYYCDEPLP